MGVVSTLALAIIPLAKRPSQPTTEELEIENTRLRAEIAVLKEMTADRDRRGRQSQILQMRAQMQCAQAQQAQHHCDCTPPHGRAGFFRGDN